MIRIEHINITVSKLERSFDFYNTLFGFRVRWQGAAIAEVGEVRAWHIGNNDTFIAMFEAEQPGSAVSDYGKPGINHVCFEVCDLDKYRKILKLLKIPIHLEADYEPGERIYFMDPDGNEIELVEYK